MIKNTAPYFPYIRRIAVLVCLSLVYGSSGFCSISAKIQFKGIKIQAIAPNLETKFDVDLMDADTAVNKLRAAIELIYEKSPDLSQTIDKLKQEGKIYIVYNPNYPSKKQDLTMVRVALFLPFYFNEESKNKKPPLPIIVSRHGIKWPLEELAAVMVHELTGHGNQYLKGMTDTVATRELECDAWLLQEQAYQQFGLDKSTKKMVDFRKGLSGYGRKSGHCTPFLNYLRKTYPEKIALYERLNPDVPELRKLLKKYITQQEKSGATKKALQAKAEFIESKLTRLEKHGTPKQIFGAGLYLLEGAGYKQDPERGVRLIKKAAGQNYARAQYHLATLYSSGKGVGRDNSLAYFWLSVAARNATADLKKTILKKQNTLARDLSKETRTAIDQKVEKWGKGQQSNS